MAGDELFGELPEQAEPQTAAAPLGAPYDVAMLLRVRLVVDTPSHTARAAISNHRRYPDFFLTMAGFAVRFARHKGCLRLFFV